MFPFPKNLLNNLVVQELDSELMIYNLESNRAFCLNETAAVVWQHCDGKTGVGEIAVRLSERQKSAISEEVVLLALSQLEKEKLIERSELTESVRLLPRREVIKRLGMAGAVAIPIVAAVVAPEAVFAQSCGAFNNNMMLSLAGCPCMGNNDCMSNNCAMMVCV